MNLFADAFSVRGNAHPICQDFSLSFERNENEKCIVVCDGCGSVKTSHIGSTILGLSAKRVLLAKAIHLDKMTYAGFIDDVLPVFGMVSELLRIESMTLASTLCVGFTTTNDVGKSFFKAFIYGDGVVFAKNRETGAEKFWQINYKSNAPYYPMYMGTPQEYVDFLLKMSHEPTNEKVIITENDITEVAYDSVVEIVLPLDDYDVVGICTDGVESMTMGSNETVLPTPEVLTELTSFKTIIGSFVERRLMKAMRTYASKGYQPYDDVSVGAIVINH